MSLFLILLAAGDSKRLESTTPKPFHKINNITLLEHTINAFNDFGEIKKTVIVYNKKHKKYLNKLKLNNTIKVVKTYFFQKQRWCSLTTKVTFYEVGVECRRFAKCLALAGCVF